MTDQDAFNIMMRHLIAQGERSEKGGECAYRGDRGLTCPLGALIPDSEYSTKLEGFGVEEVYEKLHCLQGLDPTLLIKMQNLHDDEPVDSWLSRGKEIAKQYNLEFPEELK